MAEKKKVYKIVINGLSESVDMTKSLNDQLADIESTLKRIGKQSIKIKGDVEVDTSKAKKIVSGNEAENASSKEALVNKEKELAVQKQINAEIKATGQAQAALTEEYREALSETIKQQNATKEVKQQMTDMFNGARDSAGNYTNTLAGLRAELRDLTKEQKSVELGTEEYNQLDDRILALTSNIKALEQAHGDFRRNVGNYPTAEVEAFRAKFEELYNQMQNLVQESNDLQRQLSQKTPGSEEYQQLQEKLRGVQTELQKARESVENFNNSMKATPKNFEIKVGDTVRNFNSVKDAVKTLTKELQQMTIEGKTETKQFQDTITTLGRLKTAIKSASDETASYVGNAKGLSDTLEIMRGVSGIVGIGQGLQMLFGDANKELNETIQKFMGLTLVIQGIETQVKAVNDKTSIWGKTLGWVWNVLDKIGKWTGLDFVANYFDKAANSAKNYQSALKAINDWSADGEFSQKWNNVVEQIKSAEIAVGGFSRKFKVGFEDIVNTIEGFKISISTAPMEEKLESINHIITTIEDKIAEVNAKRLDPSVSTEELDKLRQEFYDLQSQLHQMEDWKLHIESGDTEEMFRHLNNDIIEFEAHMDELDDLGIDTTELKDLCVEIKTMAQRAKVANAEISKTPTILKSMGAAGKVAAVGFEMLAMGIKTATLALKAFGKATIILAVMQVAMELIAWLAEKLSKVFSAFLNIFNFTGMETADRLEMIADAAEKASKKLDEYADAVDRAAKSGFIRELDAEVLKLKAMEAATIDAAKALKDYLNIQDEIEAKELKKSLNNSNILGDAEDIKNIDDFIEHYHTLEKAVEMGVDKIEAGWKRGTGWLLTAGDAVEQLGDDTKAILGDMQNEINKINFNNPEQAVKQFKQITDNELYQSAIANMHKLFPEEEWAQTLDRMYQIFSDRVADMEGRAQDLGSAILAANKQLENQTRLSNINAIADPNKRQAALDAYNKEQRQNEIRNSLADEKHKQDALAALDNEYNQKAIDRQKSHSRSVSKTARSTGNDLANVMRQIRDNQTAIMKEGLDKEIKLLENQREDELKAAEKAGKLRGELELSIQNKYNYLIQKKREEWFKKYKKTIEDFNEEIIEVEKRAAQELADIMGMKSLNEINRQLDENENQRAQRKRSIQYDYTIDASENLLNNEKVLQQQKQFHQQMLEEDKKYLEEKQRLQLEESKQTMENLLREETERYMQQIAENKKAQKQKWEDVAEMAKQGIVTAEEADKMQQELVEKYETAEADMFEAHQRKMTEIERNAEQERRNILEQSLQERQQIQAESNSKTIQSIRDMYDEISYISEEEQRKNTNRVTGLFNLGKERKRLKEVKEAYEQTLNEIGEEYEKLKQQFDEGEINFEQLQEGKKELDDIRKSTETSVRETSENLKDLFQTWGESINNFTQKIASQFQDLYSSFNEILNLKYDIQEEALNKEQEQLDRESEIIDNAYDKQAEIVERYKDRINETEDELKTARGERRLALIDGLAKQREAYLQETNVLKQQQLEKEKIAKKEEALKQKQDALEKKRKQQQQQQSLINAIINTALGVTQALGAWPPPASYAFAAAVGALGAVQIGLISSQKYAQGGQLDAPSHQQGGYKIPTKRGIAEVEGNEFVVNKRTTMQNLDMMYFVNSIKRPITLDDFEKYFNSKGKISISPSHSLRFATGGQLGDMTDFNLKQQIQPVQQEADKTYVVQVVDIANAMDSYENVKTLAGLAD